MSPRPIPLEVREKLSKLLPRLSSPFGERVATIAAIQRVLGTEGLDWHDFTAAFEQQQSAPPPPPFRSRANPDHDGEGLGPNDANTMDSRGFVFCALTVWMMR